MRQIANKDDLVSDFTTVHIRRVLEGQLYFAHNLQLQLQIFSRKHEGVNVSLSHNHDLIRALLLLSGADQSALSRVDIHGDRFLTKLKLFDLQSLFVILLVVLIDPKRGKFTLSVHCEDKVRVTVEQLDHGCTEMAYRAHFEAEFLVFTVHILVFLDTRTPKIALLPAFHLVLLVEKQLLSQEAPHEVVLGNVLAVTTRTVKVDQVVCAQELETLLQG